MRRIVYLLIFLSCCNTGWAQNSVNYKTVDEETYRFYMNGNWKDLINSGKNALKNNIDYYYLRMRIGIAYYETKRYMQAAKHFEKA